MKSTIKSLFIIHLILGFAPQGFSEISRSEFNQLKAKIEELEFQNYSKNYHINGDMEVNYESLNIDYNNSDSDENVSLFGLHTRLHMAFDVNNKINFYSTLGMSKFFQTAKRKERFLDQDLDNDNDNDREAWEQSQMSGYGYEGPNAKFDRAYFNFLFSPTMTFSVGRLPSQGGPPSEQFDGQSRSGTMPRSARNSVYDGFALTYDLSRLVDQKNNLKFKFYYIPWQNVDKTDRTKQVVTPSTTTNKPGPNKKVDSHQLSTGFQIESFTRSLSWTKEVEVHLFTIYYEDFWWTQYEQYYSGYTYTASVGFNGIMQSNFNITFVLNGTEWWTKDDPNTKINGEGLLVNMNYRFETNDILGIELIKTNDDHYADDFSYLSLTSMYKAKGANGGHFWWSTPLYDNLRFRLGAYSYNMGTSTKSDFKSLYSKLLLKF